MICVYDLCWSVDTLIYWDVFMRWCVDVFTCWYVDNIKVRNRTCSFLNIFHIISKVRIGLRVKVEVNLTEKCEKREAKLEFENLKWNYFTSAHHHHTHTHHHHHPLPHTALHPPYTLHTPYCSDFSGWHQLTTVVMTKFALPSTQKHTKKIFPRFARKGQ